MNVKTPSKNHNFYLVLILVGGAVLRLTRLGYQSEWNDEALSVDIAKSTAVQVITNQFHSRHPPGYYLLLHYWQAILGDSDFALRLLSAIAGILGVVVMYWVGKTLFSQKTGLWAAAITAIMPYHLFYSQEIRSYSWLFLLSAVMMLGQAKIWSGASGRIRPNRWWLIYAVAAVMGLYMHYLFPLAVGAMALHFMIRRWQSVDGPDWKPFMLVHGIIGLLYLPIFLLAIREAGGPAYWLEKTSLGEFFSMPLTLTIGQFLPFALTMVAYGLILVLLIITMLQVGRAFYQKATERAELGLVVLTYWFPVLILFTVAIVWQPLTTPRFLALAVPGLYLLLAWGMTLTKEKYFNAGLVVLLLGLGLWANYNWLFVEQYQKTPVREAVAHLQELAGADEPIYYANDSGLRLFHHYAPDLNHHLFLDINSPYANPTIIPEVIELTGGTITTPDEELHGRFWLVLHLDFDIELQQEIFAEFESRYERIASENVSGILMYKYDAGSE